MERMVKSLITFIATLGGLGRLGVAPGTLGSLMALLLGWLGFHYFELNVIGLWLAVVLSALVGWWAADRYQAWQNHESDPQEVIIDELSGMWLALALQPTAILADSLWPWLGCFFAFRFFDILKPGPIGWADRQIKGGLGIMLDDWLAGLAAGLAVLVVRLIWHFIQS